jgi:DNA-binding IclR family transcriptional regulator
MENRRTSIGVLDKVMDILASFDKGAPLKPPREVAETLRMPLSSVYRFMQAMAEHGLLERDGREFRLGLRLASLGSRATKDMDIRRVALPHMRGLSQKTGEHTRLSVRRGSIRVVVESVAGTNNRWPLNSVGETLPLGIGSAGLVMIAWLPRHEALSLASESFAIFGIKHRTDSLRKRLQKVRTQGYVVSLGERHPEVNAVAAPIFNEGEVVAALSLTAPVSRCPPKQIKVYTPWVVEAARRITSAFRP